MLLICKAFPEIIFIKNIMLANLWSIINGEAWMKKVIWAEREGVDSGYLRPIYILLSISVPPTEPPT